MWVSLSLTYRRSAIYPGLTPVSTAGKTDRHNMTLNVKVALNSKQSNQPTQ